MLQFLQRSAKCLAKESAHLYPPLIFHPLPNFFLPVCRRAALYESWSHNFHHFIIFIIIISILAISRGHIETAKTCHTQIADQHGPTDYKKPWPKPPPRGALPHAKEWITHCPAGPGVSTRSCSQAAVIHRGACQLVAVVHEVSRK